MFDDFKELLSLFNAHSVKYLIVGGYAVSLHAQPRATKDLGLFIKADQANAKAIYAALASFGAPIESINIEDLSDPGKFIRFGREPVAVDILPSLDGVVFDEAWKGAWNAPSTLPVALLLFSYPRRTLSLQNSQPAALAILPTLKRFGRQRPVNQNRNRSSRCQITRTVGPARSELCSGAYLGRGAHRALIRRRTI
jgi:hypothetical protein